jgi:hypothetical protein
MATAPEFFPETLPTEVAAASPYVNAVLADWSTVDTLWGGTDAMRRAGERFLPKEPLEKDEDWIRRRDRTTLHNYYKRTITTGVAKIFTKDPHLDTATGDVSEDLTTFIADVDTQGRNIGQFSKEALEDSVNHGVSYILVDYARAPRDFATLADQKKAGNRPYWVSITAPQVLEARSAKFDDGERLAFFKYRETIIEPSNILYSAAYEQIRMFVQIPPVEEVRDADGTVLFPGIAASPVYFAVYRRHKDTQGEWKRHDFGVISTSSIPITPVYTNKVAYYLGRPPLKDLAELNIEHWQTTSDYKNILHVVGVPILVVSGFTPEVDEKGKSKQLEIAPNAAVNSPSKDASIRWVEHTGKSIDSLRTNIKDLEARMESLGMVLTAIQHAGVSATANQINTAEANSMLKSFALNLQDSLNAVMDFTCEFLNIENTVRVVVNTEYAQDYTTNETMGDVIDMFKEGVISAEVVISEGKRRNVLDNAAVIIPPSAPAPAQQPAAAE